MKLLSLLALVLACGLAVAAQAPASKATVNLYASKCAACHGADGSAAVPAGKALGAHDFHSPEVLNQTDDQLNATITNGKLKMPAFGKQLTPAQIKDLVAYVRELGAKK